MPPLAVTRTGEPTGAVYGFASMIFKVLSEVKPTHWAIAFDTPAPTFRHQQYVDYKAHRPSAPDELRVQFARVRRLTAALGLCSFEVPGYEADDVLGSMARQASDRNMDTIILTGDTDALQLVSPHVRVLTPRPGKRFSDTVVYDQEAVQQRYSLLPRQLADLRGLKGDPSDNIPGVPGVGEKTATKLIQEFESIEGIYECIDKVQPEKLRMNLKENEARARQSKQLALIVTDLPISFEQADCRVGAYNREEVAALFRELEFSTLLAKLPESLGVKPPAELAAEEGVPHVHIRADVQPVNYQVIDSPEELDRISAIISGTDRFSIDTETTGLDPRQAALVGVSLSIAPGTAWYIPVGHHAGNQLPLDRVIAALKPPLEDSRKGKITHNGKYDLTILRRYGVRVKNICSDTMIASYLLGEKSLGLKALSFARLGIEMIPITNLIGTGPKQVPMAWVDIPRVAEYACADADMTNRLCSLLEAELKSQGLWKLFVEVEMPLLPILLRMEANGVALDVPRLRDMSWQMGARLAKLEAAICESVGRKFNVNSTQQLAAILYEDLKLPRSRKIKSGYSTGAAVLEDMRGLHPIIDMLLDYRQISKLKSTYVDALPALVDPETGRVHTYFNQTGTTTGRLSSSEPNLQNIPVRTEEGRQVRRAFIAGSENNILVAADYSQIDLRVLAHLSQDPRLVDAFNRDEDIHRTTAAQVFNVPASDVTPDMRRLAKTVNFGVIYGMSEYGLEQATELSRQEAGEFIRAYFEKYSGVKRFLDATKQEAAQKGYVQTMLGRRRYIPEINSSNGQVRQAAQRMAINMPVQGTSADIIKVAMIELQEEMDRKGLKSIMILQVHDELLFEAPREEVPELTRLLFRIMPNAVELNVPLKIDIKSGRNWDEMEYSKEVDE